MSAQPRAPGLAPAVASTLGMLLGRTVTSTATKGAALPPASVAATFTRDDGSVDAIVVAPVPLAGMIGAALALIPPGVAASSANGATLPAGLAENYAEVMNVVCSALGQREKRHLRFRGLSAQSALPPPAAEVVKKPAERVDLDVAVAGYGRGVMSVLFAHGAT